MLQYVNNTTGAEHEHDPHMGKDPDRWPQLRLRSRVSVGLLRFAVADTDDGFFGLIGATRASFIARSVKSVRRSVSAACRKVKKVLQAAPAR